jgi:HAMP domain-containing protein
MKKLSTLITSESEQIVQKMAEDIIAQKARTVAKQCALYLKNNPGLTKEQFQGDSRFRQIAVQKVGKTGYTGVYDRREVDGGCRTWAHVNQKIIGMDMRKLKKSLGKAFGPFWKIWSSVKKNKEARGYYDWRDTDGRIRSKYAVCTPIQGTPYAVGATTYLDEFMQPIQQIQTQAAEQTGATTTIVIVVMIATLVLIGLIVSLYGRSLISKIRRLTDTADRISVGELDAEIDIKSSDEIGELAEAISRMQDSIRLSIQRLRQRR